MFSLPFRPPPLPDGILGSWLERLRLLNGEWAWQDLRRSAGYTSAPGGQITDGPDYSPELGSLLTSLGTTFEASLLHLTTFPYWLSFDGSSPGSGVLQGTSALPLLCGAYGKPRRTVQRLGLVRSMPVNGLRYCPACLVTDLSNFGEPYWHRFHQLPLVRYCPMHLVALRSACPRCGRAFFPDMNGRSPLPRLTCPCGFALSQDRETITPTALQVRHAAVSLDALANHCTTWDRKQMRAFLQSKLHGTSAITCLFDAWGDETEAGSNTLIRDPWLLLEENKSVDGMRAPACCALLAALGIDFKTAARGAARTKAPEQTTAPEPTSLRMATSVGRACDILSELTNRSPHTSPSHFGIHYWIVRICAPEWFAQRFPQSKCRPLPSVTADRAAIRHHLARVAATSPSSYAVSLVRHCSAAQRARVRDREWLDQLSDHTLRAGPTDKSKRRSDRHQASFDVAADKFLQEACTRPRPGESGPFAPEVRGAVESTVLWLRNIILGRSAERSALA
ncbi:TniQ family protein [Paraburkholderia sp. BR10923]|uniref:TniQ family protein n=2 Tax=Paraburkholderia youngii TaxID=2782701 RepID=A0A7Y6JXN3_9BURK|nr:TniQ family protein [Paraburkholderia youngii]